MALDAKRRCANNRNIEAFANFAIAERYYLRAFNGGSAGVERWGGEALAHGGIGGKVGNGACVGGTGPDHNDESAAGLEAGEREVALIVRLGGARKDIAQRAVRIFARDEHHLHVGNRLLILIDDPAFDLRRDREFHIDRSAILGLAELDAARGVERKAL